MALDARTRSSLYGKFAELVGDDDANALMSEFPSVEADELVTKQFLRAELEQLRSELMSELRGEIGGLRSELRGEMGGLRSELRGEMGGLRSELRGEIGGLRSEIVELRTDMLERFHQQTVWFGGALAAATALLATIGVLS